jgi:hypothetical protein
MAFVHSNNVSFAQAMRAVKLFKQHEKKGLLTIQSLTLEVNTVTTLRAKAKPRLYKDASVYTLCIEYSTQSNTL